MSCALRNARMEVVVKEEVKQHRTPQLGGWQKQVAKLDKITNELLHT